MIKPTNVTAELMIAEHRKMLSQERRKLPSVQSLTDKMGRLTHRKAVSSKPMLNELTTGDKNVTFSGSNNHSTSTTKATSSEGKKGFTGTKITHNSLVGLDILPLNKNVV